MQRIIVIYLTYLISLVLCGPAWAVEVDHINGISITSHKTYQGVWAITKIKAHNGFAIASATPPLTCTSYVTNSTGANSIEVARYNAAQLSGIIWDDGSSGSICAYKIKIDSYAGTITGKDLYAEVWLLGASSVLSSLVGRSDKLDSQNWTNTQITFSFSTPVDYDCTGSNQYSIHIKVLADGDAATTAGKYDRTNYLIIFFSNGTNTMTGNVAMATWNSATGALASSDAADMPVAEVWTMQ